MPLRIHPTSPTSRRVLAGLAGLAAVLPLTSAAHAASVPQQARADLAARVESLVTRSSPLDPLYYESPGIWNVGDTFCTRCLLGPAVAASALKGADARYDAQVIETVDRYLARQTSNGMFPKGNDGSDPGIETIFSLNSLETIAFAMRDRLPAAVLRRWSDAIARGARALIASGDTMYYSNGNLALANAALLAGAATLTGDPALEAAFEKTFAFMQAPGARFPDRGLRIVTAPSRADGADGAGYFTETGAGGTGFDPHYTQVQLDFATSLWLRRPETRTLRIVRLLGNMLRTRTNGSWIVDTSNGTRHPKTGISFPALSAGLAVGQCGAAGQSAAASQWNAGRVVLDLNLDLRSLGDNSSWAAILGTTANMALLPDDLGCSGADGSAPAAAPASTPTASAGAAPAAGMTPSPSGGTPAPWLVPEPVAAPTPRPTSASTKPTTSQRKRAAAARRAKARAAKARAVKRRVATARAAKARAAKARAARSAR